MRYVFIYLFILFIFYFIFFLQDMRTEKPDYRTESRNTKFFGAIQKDCHLLQKG